ncbi:hypothetical protein [Glaesserella parasuis]|uniref:Uncharacterized protein n=1 Tax=Glaesserella parasuis TaxID=738 RepID=A0AAJ6D9Y7_GLAPU|nr:hypothetical protein [Glaesserella parasuis]WGE10017.1 hypothetical protein QBL01_12610 [Glaesserella parasuis]
MRNQIPTHYALEQGKVGNIQRFTDYARSILTLISHDYLDGMDGESDDFLTSHKTIRTALDAVNHFLEESRKTAKTAYISA